jgi:hypothetical protein
MSARHRRAAHSTHSTRRRQGGEIEEPAMVRASHRPSERPPAAPPTPPRAPTLDDFPPLPPWRAREARELATASGWPAHCPDPRCATGSCRGALRRLTPTRPREHPTCLAFALRARVEADALTPDEVERAEAMMPTLFIEPEEGEGEWDPAEPGLGGLPAEAVVVVALIMAST